MARKKKPETIIKSSEVLRLRLEGLTLAEIGDRLGFTRQYAHTLLKEALNRDAEDARESREDLRQIMEARYEKIFNVLWSRAVPVDGDKEIRLDYLDRIIKLLDKETTLLGITGHRKTTFEAEGIEEFGISLANIAMRYIPHEQVDKFRKEVESVSENYKRDQKEEPRNGKTYTSRKQR